MNNFCAMDPKADTEIILKKGSSYRADLIEPRHAKENMKISVINKENMKISLIKFIDRTLCTDKHFVYLIQYLLSRLLL